MLAYKEEKRVRSTVSGRATAMRVYSWGICTFPFHYRAALPLVQYVQTCYRMSHLLSLVTSLMCQQNCFGEMIGVLLVNVGIPTYVSFLSTVHILSYFCPAPVSIMSHVCPMSHYCLISQFQCYMLYVIICRKYGKKSHLHLSFNINIALTSELS